MKDSNPQHSCCKQDALPIELITPNAHRSLPSGRDLAARSAAVIAQRRPAQQVVDPCLAPCFKGLGGHETRQVRRALAPGRDTWFPEELLRCDWGTEWGRRSLGVGRTKRGRPVCASTGLKRAARSAASRRSGPHRRPLRSEGPIIQNMN